MSTNQQRFSLENQASTIEKYADTHGLVVVQTYLDPARTGVVFRARVGLQRLIRDVVKGNVEYKAILVYDISRWGRFQDSDEAAYYEFLCKSAGVPIHYCAEGFSNDNAIPNVLLKSLKRVMAAEYSRELGVKVSLGQSKLARLGFRMGGQPGYGLQRLLVSADATPKHLLRNGERKSLASDRVIQVPGAPDEVRCVNEIFLMFVQQRMKFSAIARELNRCGIKYLRNTAWDGRAVQNILSHPKYAGCCVYGRSKQRLYAPLVRVPQSEWIVAERAFYPLVEAELFAEAQTLLQDLHESKSDRELIDDLRPILAKHGKLTINLVEHTSGLASPDTYRRRFGTFTRVYQLLGYSGSSDEQWLKKIRNIQALRNGLMHQIVAACPGRVSISKGPTHHTRLRLHGGRLVAVLAARCVPGYKGSIRWLLNPLHGEQHYIALVARLNARSDGWNDMFVIPPLGKAKTVLIREEHIKLQRGVPLSDFANFLAAVQEVAHGTKRRLLKGFDLNSNRQDSSQK